jgi:thiol-disulfide isomerase/thioredoxin
MRAIWVLIAVATFLALSIVTPAQEKSSAASKSSAENQKKAPDPEAELAKALADSGNDSAALVRNLKAYLEQFPGAPRKPAVYRALVEACQQLRDETCALEYSERLIALRPDDSQLMLLAINLLEVKNDDASLVRASGYATRVLDRIEKSSPEERSPRESVAEWKDGQQQLRAALYYIRGHIEELQRNYDAAKKDLQASYTAHPNALAAKTLGEIDEMQNDPDAAIHEYVLAFTQPEAGPAGQVDRRVVRRELANVWREVHGSDAGLGDAILSAYDWDAASSAENSESTAPTTRNKNAKRFYDFVVRRMDGTPLPLASATGKVVVLSFWATWCGPCRELEPIFNQVARTYAGNSGITFFAVDADDDEARVAPFVAQEKWDSPVIYADGLDDFMKVETLPTVLIIGRSGKIVYRTSGAASDGFPEALSTAIETALESSH